MRLPEGEGFRALPAPLALDTWLRLNRELRRWFPAGLPTEEERWQRKRAGPFRL